MSSSLLLWNPLINVLRIGVLGRDPGQSVVRSQSQSIYTGWRLRTIQSTTSWHCGMDCQLINLALAWQRRAYVSALFHQYLINDPGEHERKMLLSSAAQRRLMELTVTKCSHNFRKYPLWSAGVDFHLIRAFIKIKGLRRSVWHFTIDLH